MVGKGGGGGRIEPHLEGWGGCEGGEDIKDMPGSGFNVLRKE